MAEIRNYTIGINRIKRGYRKGFKSDEAGTLYFSEKETNLLFLRKLDSREAGFQWGRLHMEYELSKDSICTVRAFASDSVEFDEFFADKEIPLEQKEWYFRQEGALTFRNCKDMLLYEAKGRYLWICMEAVGEGKIRNLRVHTPGDNFMDTFPEIYREKGGFFHRYLSIFSSVYMDFQKKIDCAEQQLDFDTAPRELLYTYGSWIGIDIGNFLEENKIRTLLKNTYSLNRLKGSRRCLELLIQLILEERPIIVERSLISEQCTQVEAELYDRLYGTEGFDVTVLIGSKEEETLKSQLLYLLNQFKPVRSRLNIVFYGKCGILDSYCYLDLNAGICSTPRADLDRNNAIGRSVVLL